MSERSSFDPSLANATWQRWQMSSFDDPVMTDDVIAPAPTLEPTPDPEILRHQWQAEAYAQGHAEGLRDGHAEGVTTGLTQGRAEGHAMGLTEGYAVGLAQGREQAKVEAEELHTLSRACARALSELEEKVGQGLLTLALDIASQVLRTTLSARPESMLPAVREVLQMVPHAGGVLRLWVHPQDLELLRHHLNEELRDGNWRVLTDESIIRGGCRVESALGDIDATLQTRWRRVAASLGHNASWDETS